MSRSRTSSLVVILIAIGFFGLLAAFAYNLPFVQDRIGWRISKLRADIKYALVPPEEAVFTPNPTVVAIVQATLDAFTPTATPTPLTSPTPGPTSTATLSPTPTISPTPLPSSVQLNGVRHEYQKWNNCGPANLAMALSYWDWEGDQIPVAAFLKPNTRDKNIMPYEMVEYVETQTNLNALIRVGGDLDLIKHFIAAGFPILVEKGFEGPGFNGWMGHYEVLTGYDDAKSTFTAQDSYIMPNLPVAYDQLEKYWRHFNYTYIVIFPPEREAEVLELLGPQTDEAYNFQFAAQKASNEIFTLTGRDQFFAWFNRGTNLMRLQDYMGAAGAYDEAFNVLAQINTELEEKPWRMMWYQTGPYWAYFYTGRYYDVISLATQTLTVMSEAVLEESYYWRALAKEALGDLAGAIEDLQKAARVHPDWEPALVELQRLGASP
jgi:tetratricopeptide (TPR) repeat protein